MSSISREEWRELLEGHSTQVLVGDWVVAADAAAGSTQFTVVIAETATSTSSGVAPVIGTTDVPNFIGSRVVFGRGAESAALPTGPVATTGLNFGFSTTIATIATTGNPAVTTITVADAIPKDLKAQDSITIYRPLVLQIAAPSSYHGTVGSGSTTTAVVDSIGGWQTDQWKDYGIQFTDDTVTAGLRGKWRQISSNTANTLTLESALPDVPVAGDTYDLRIFASQVMDLKSIGGQSVPGNPIGTDGSAAPTTAMAVGGSDGTDLQTLKTDTDGTGQSNITKIAGTPQTGADWTPLLQGAATKQGALTDGSGTITAGGTPQQVFAANASRRYFLLQNLSSGDLWFNFGVDAVTSQPSLKLAAGQSFVLEQNFVSTELVSIIGATTGAAFAAKEG